MKTSDKNKHYDWIVTPDTYLATALLLSNNIPSGMHDEAPSSGSVLKKLGFRSAHPNYELLLPIIFNFKHGIELYVKGLGCLSFNKYKNNHDLRDLFNIIIANSIGNNKKVLQKLKKDTWSVIEKYYYGTYIPSNRNKKNPDTHNAVERYPEISQGYDLPDRYKWVTNGLVKQVGQDVKFIEKKFAQAKRDIK